MPFNTLDLPQELSPEDLAITITTMFDRWKMDRLSWEKETTDIRNTLFASTIDTTTNSTNPFLNRTTLPKLTQIYDNLIANYDASLFPNQDWFVFESESVDGAMKDKKRKIKNYLKTKTRQLKFRVIMRQLLADWLLTGNCFAGLDFVREYTIDSVTGEKVLGYVGPKPYRIAPLDVVFDVKATSFNKAPKIIRTLKTLGQMAREVETHPELGYTKELIKKIAERRSLLTPRNKSNLNYDEEKLRALKADGFGTLQEYYRSNLVEILEFYGDVYIEQDDKLHPNHVITVVDRANVIRNEPVKSWNGDHNIFTAAWRNRPDNLMGMSPFANLLGMQHRLDKLENTKADVFDQIAYPIMIEKGDVEYYDGEGNLNGMRGTPGGFYRADADGDVNVLRPDATALNADFQIQNLMMAMEELAGAPKNTMGIRTPGEKTAFEVQTLDNAASRIFQNKVAYLEEEFLEPLLNAMLEMARRNLDVSDVIKMTDDQLGVDTFIELTKNDLTAAGKIYAVGSRYFARNATIAQNLTMLSNSPLFQLVQNDLDRHSMTQLLESILGLEQFSLFRANIGIEQQLESQRLIQTAQEQLAAESQTPAEGMLPNETDQPPST